jgi:predicted Zn-dependent protease
LPIINKTDEQPFFQELVNKKFADFLKNSNIELIPEKEVIEYLKKSGYDPVKKEFPSKDILKYLAIMTNADDVIGLSLENIARFAPTPLEVTYKLSAQVSVQIIEYERYRGDVFTYDFKAKGESTNTPYEGVSMKKAIINATNSVLDEAFKSYDFSGFSNL